MKNLHACTTLHLDMDAFYAAIEQRDRPELRGLPVIVGSPPNRRGVVSTASYEARRFGVHSAMPSRTAYKRCPHAVFLPVRMQHYAAVSSLVMATLRRFTPLVEPISIDEAFMDVHGVLRNWGSPVELAAALKREIHSELGLTASVGVAPNKFLAKLASDLEKPDGLTVVPADEAGILAFLAPLPVKTIWGIGRATAARLERRGIRTIAQIQALALPELATMLGPTLGYHVWQLAHGRDARRVHPEKQEEKSISNEETFPEDCTDGRFLRQTLIELTEKVGRRLRQARKVAGVAQIKVRFGDFRTITRQRSLPTPSDTDRDLLECALALFEREQVQAPVRLLGFGVSALSGPTGRPGPAQLSLFEPETRDDDRAHDLDRAVDELRARYGKEILKRGDWSP